MGTEVAPEDKELPKCGRLVFRGVELAYLNIDGEFMLPLAELLALVLPSTPRTTLFTRMEKMKVRRHFCQPEEIKLLKTVNGIHGSSANCTLLSKTEVDKYCSMYIDNLSASNKGKSTEHNTNDSKIANEQRRADNCKAKVDMESVHRNNNEIPNKLTVLHKHKKSSPLKAKLKLTKVASPVKLKSALSSDSLFNQTLTDSASRQTIDLKCASVNELVEGILPVSSQSFCSSHTSQTLPLLANNKRLKKRDKNLNSEANKKGKSSRARKRLSNDEEIRQEFETPLKIPKRSEIHGHRKENNKISETSNEFQPVCSLQASQKQDVDFLGVSDASSNDSGFASTALSNASSPIKTDFSAGELSGLLKRDEEAVREHEHSPLRPPKLKTPTKIKGRGNNGKSLTLSPPALVLKRYEDSWQVEQKSPVKEVVNCLPKSKVKSKEKAREVGLTRFLFEETCGKAQHIKQVKKRRKSRKPLDLREETSITNDLIVGEKTDVSGRKKKGKQKAKLVGGEKSSDFSTAKETKTERLSQGKESSKTQLNDKQQSKQELFKKEAVLDRLVGDALAKFFGPKTSTSDSTPSTSSNTPTKPISKKPKVAGTKKPVLKTNSNFKLLNLFPVTSQLALQDGSLCPVFTMSCPKGVRPLSSHPIWKWRLGQPVVQDSAQTFLKPAPVTKPKKAQPSCTTKTISNKVRTLKRKRRKRLQPTGGKVPLASSTVSLSACANAAVCTDFANQNVSTGLDECNEVCNEASVNAVASSAEITVN